MKIKDIKWLKRWTRFKQNTQIKLNGKDMTIELQQDQDGNWTINLIEASNDSKDSKDS